MKKILVPIDFSKPSEYAAKMAAKIAKKTGASITLIHLIELPSEIVDIYYGSRFSIPESMLYLRKIKEKILDFKNNFFTEDIKVNYFIKLNNPFDGIKKYADKIDADLIIMGSRGHSKFEEIIIGSVGLFFTFKKAKIRSIKIELKTYFKKIAFMSIVVFFAILFSFLGLKQTNPIIASLLFLAAPLTTILFSAFFFKEKLSKKNIVFIIIIVLGAFILHFQNN